MYVYLDCGIFYRLFTTYLKIVTTSHLPDIFTNPQAVGQWSRSHPYFFEWDQSLNKKATTLYDHYHFIWFLDCFLYEKR